MSHEISHHGCCALASPSSVHLNLTLSSYESNFESSQLIESTIYQATDFPEPRKFPVYNHKLGATFGPIPPSFFYAFIFVMTVVLLTMGGCTSRHPTNIIASEDLEDIRRDDNVGEIQVMETNQDGNILEADNVFGLLFPVW